MLARTSSHFLLVRHGMAAYLALHASRHRACWRSSDAAPSIVLAQHGASRRSGFARAACTTTFRTIAAGRAEQASRGAISSAPHA